MRELRNLKVIMSYSGSVYHGFQIQQNAVTIQETVETAITKLLKSEHSIIGCSRTDTGVHAREFCFNTKTSSTIPCNGFVRGLNALLPHDISIHSCEEADEDFHARYSAKSKEYCYHIHNGKVRDVFMRDLAHFYPYELDLATMQEAARLFIGEHDFSAYCKAESLSVVKARKHGAVREIYDFSVTRNGDYVELTISGNGFLHNMVRILTGTLLYVSEGKLSYEDVRRSLSGGQRSMAGITLPACGLYLNKVKYE
jgi:tRNA pseudouridine38-40 synthase